jgi:hypothetical protein
MIFKQIGALKKENKLLNDENLRLIKELRFRRSIISVLEENVPKEQEERKQYVQQIAHFYSIFKDKLAHMVSQQKDTLAMIGLTKQEEDILRSNISCLNLIDEWFDMKTKEHFGDLHAIRESLDGDEDIINNLKQKISYEN